MPNGSHRSTDNSFRVLYPCHTGVIPTISFYNFSEIAHAVPVSMSVIPKIKLSYDHLFTFFFITLCLSKKNTKKEEDIRDPNLK